MFILKKILTPFLVPPGIFIVLLILIGTWFLNKKHWKLGIITYLIGGLIWLSSIEPVSDALLKSLEFEFKILQNPQGDVIVLLGGGSYIGALDLSGIGFPSEDTLGRIVTTVRLQKKLNIPVIVSSGQVFKNEPSESLIIRRLLIDLGVPSNKIIIEDKSRDTRENARYTKEICKKQGFSRPILVTSAYHMRRAVLIFKKAGVDVLPLPANFRTGENISYGWQDYLPEASELKNTSIAIREYLGILFYNFAY